VGVKPKENFGVSLTGKPLFSEGPYAVYVGTVDADGRGDIPHYLIVNIQTTVVEGSAARLFEARGMCSMFAKELAEQDDLLSKGEAIVEQVDRGTSKKWSVQ
jgi:hypothetical protein